MALRLLYDFDDFDSSTAIVTESSQVSSDLASENVNDDRVGKIWRTTGDSDEWIQWDFLAAKTFDCVGLFNHNFTSSAVVKFQGHTSASWGSPDVDETLTIATDADSNVIKHVVKYFSSASKQFWRLHIADSLNPKGYVQVGRLVAGAHYEPTRSANDGWRIEYNDVSEGERVPGQTPVLRKVNKFRKAIVQFSYMDQTQQEKMEAIWNKVGNTEPLVLSLDHAGKPTERSMYAYLVTPLDMAQQIVEQHEIAQLVFEEKTR